MTESRKIELHHLEDRYFSRMAASVGDKSRLLKYLPSIEDPTNPPRILDVGSGGGEFAHALSLMGYDVTALDVSEEAINRIKFRYSELDTIQALANHTQDFGHEVFDVIICSSILHEVFSYGDDVHRTGHVSSISRAVQSFRESLKTGGLLLIRDGVLPANWEDEAGFTLLDGHDPEVVKTYLNMCPFANGSAYGNQGRLVSLTQVADSRQSFVGNVRSVLEFAYTYTWGVDSYPRETQELYAVLPLWEYADLIEENGFYVQEAYSYLQPGYPEHLKDKMVLMVNGYPSPWFDSNAIWVARKI